MHIVFVNRICLINDHAGSPMSQLITANSNRQLLSTKKQSKIVIMQRAADTITPVLSRSPQAQLPNSENTNVRYAQNIPTPFERARQHSKIIQAKNIAQRKKELKWKLERDKRLTQELQACRARLLEQKNLLLTNNHGPQKRRIAVCDKLLNQ